MFVLVSSYEGINAQASVPTSCASEFAPGVPQSSRQLCSKLCLRVRVSVLTLFGFWGFSKLNDVLRDRIDEDMIVKDVAEAIKRVQRASVAFIVF